MEKKIKNIKLANFLIRVFTKGIKSIVIKNDLYIVEVERENLYDFLYFIKTNSQVKADSLLDVWGVDYPELAKRFEINYMLLSIKYNYRLMVKVRVGKDEGIKSVVTLFNSASWLEREVWDMYGVYFVEHPDLRRILTDYGFEGFPLRKDFPLSGYVEVRYDDGEKRIVVEPLEMMQDFRFFNFKSPWEKEKRLLKK